MPRPIRFPQLWDKEALENILASAEGDTHVAAEIVGCQVSPLQKALRKFGILYELKQSETTFKRGEPARNPNRQVNLTFRWGKGTKHPSFTMRGKHHTDESKQAIAEATALRVSQPGYSELLSEKGREAWARDSGVRRAAAVERMTGNSRRAGVEPWNKTNTTFTCSVCSAVKHISPAHMRRGKMLTCSRACKHLLQAGLNKDYHSGYANYDSDFTFELRRQVWERDGQKCKICGEGAGKRKLVVHHVAYDKSDSSLDLLVLLCRSCHRKGHSSHAWPVNLVG